MIDEKKIEEAAKEYCESLEEERKAIQQAELRKGAHTAYTFIRPEVAFKAGINWFKENLWHDASEEPQEDACILVQSKLGGEYYTSLYSNGEFECDSFHLLHKEITRWLYIEDLMKGGE